MQGPDKLTDVLIPPLGKEPLAEQAHCRGQDNHSYDHGHLVIYQNDQSGDRDIDEMRSIIERQPQRYSVTRFLQRQSDRPAP